MNSKDYRNIREAYLNVYNDDLREEQEFKSWVTELLDEGYDLSDYTWDEIYDIYNEAYKGGPEFGMKYSKSKPLSGEKNPDKTGYGGDEKFTKPDDKIEKPGTTVPPFKKGGYGRIMSNIPHGIGAHRDKIASKITTTTGGDPGAPTSQKMRPSEKKKNLEIIRKKTNEEYDLYDIILSHLIDEGYDLSDYTQLDEISDELATAARNLRQKRYTKSADQARNLQLSKGNRADMFYKNFDKTVKLNDTLKSREKRTGTKIPRVEQFETQLDEISDKLATAARNLRQKRYTKSADQARNLQLSKGNRADMFYKNFDKTVKLNDTLKSREKRTGTKIPRVEQLDLYDIILSHLIAEGYADTEEAAERIMVNMSEEWRDGIVEDIETQRAKYKQQRISSLDSQKRKKFKEEDRKRLKDEIIRALIQRQQTSTN